MKTNSMNKAEAAPALESSVIATWDNAEPGDIIGRPKVSMRQCPICGVVHTFRNGAPKWESVNQELLQALQALVNDWGLDETVMDGNWERAKAALAKAEGKL